MKKHDFFIFDVQDEDLGLLGKQDGGIVFGEKGRTVAWTFELDFYWRIGPLLTQFFDLDLLPFLVFHIMGLRPSASWCRE